MTHPGALLLAFIGALGLPGGARAAVDLAALWDFSNPAASEQRFRDALAGAGGDDAVILTTQIARTHGLRRDLARAKEVLASLEPRLAAAGPEARVRHALEWGRAHISAVTRPDERTPEALATARSAYQRALAVATEGRLDGLAIDAVHMMAFVDTAPADQLKWNQQALALVVASAQPEAKAWEASIRNNLAHSLHLLGRHAESLPHYERALALRRAKGSARQVYVGRWLVARALRLTGRLDEALALQTRLEGEMHVVGGPDPFVFEEIELIHRARGDAARAAAYADKLAAARRKS
ncbi:MAG: tetratricopeptide repeat protein [Rubrivivax sp.]|nr:tetratricopeptide repeat protein [Rubrivivax sp.]